MKNRITKKDGLTLLELVVTVALFGILSLLITRIYMQVLAAQDRIIDEQNLVGDVNFVTAVFNDQAQRASAHISTFPCDDYGICQYGRYFCVNSSGNRACMIDLSQIPTHYSVSNNKMQVDKGGTGGSFYDLTSSRVSFDNVKFETSTDGRQLSIKLEASGDSQYGQKIYYQNYITK